MATRSQVLSDIALLQAVAASRRQPAPAAAEAAKGGAPSGTSPWTSLPSSRALLLALQEPWAAPIALLVLGNRQRALGNILHDAAHRNLTRKRLLNDLVTRALIAPLLFASLSHYRELHFRHHLDLGAQDADPDLIPIPAEKARVLGYGRGREHAVAARRPRVYLRAPPRSAPFRWEDGCTSSLGGPCSWLSLVHGLTAVSLAKPRRCSPCGWPHVPRHST